MPYKEWVFIHIVSFLTSNNINIKNANISWYVRKSHDYYLADLNPGASSI